MAGLYSVGRNSQICCLYMFQILLDGVDIRELNVEWLRNQIGLVSQEPVLFATSIRENIQFGRMNVTEKELREAARNANIHEFIELLPEVHITRGSRYFSQGRSQRKLTCLTI